MRSAGKTQSKRRQNASKTHAIYKKIVTATHRAIQQIQLRVINTRQWEKPSSNTNSSQTKLIIRVIKRESDDRIDSITSKYKAAASIRRYMRPLREQCHNSTREHKQYKQRQRQITSKEGYKCHPQEVPAKPQRLINTKNHLSPSGGGTPSPMSEQNRVPT